MSFFYLGEKVRLTGTTTPTNGKVVGMATIFAEVDGRSVGRSAYYVVDIGDPLYVEGGAFTVSRVVCHEDNLESTERI
jgi:hypothetical protein